ncbi:ciliary-associated calcium-binding coiled-coil protein 1-like isoform X2 [Saccostrea echinata]|uniref:ciliary-associated calcium-binding coiled-coil protein 1-like isoform X2 n=1 Tax=Saccostrea echinata TaxID=191078 RepID=UPI002A83BE29|nr:ciliary-associated calcium-binding coiled-coil protein 1-like isoform X2 [Saccostrea echinata]
MATKSNTKVSGKSSKTPLSGNNLSKTDAKGKKTVTIADGEDEVDDQAESFAYKILSQEQCTELLSLEVTDIQKKLCETFSLSNYRTHLQDAATLDYYTSAIWWGKQQSFTPQQLSGFFTVVHTLFTNVKDQHLHLVDNLKEMQKMLRGIEPEYSDVKSAGLDFFNLQQAKSISEYMFTSLFQHYKLFEFMFSHTQAEEIIGTDLEIEVAKPAALPFPPPLDEGVEESLFTAYIATPPPSPEPEVTEEADILHLEPSEVDDSAKMSEPPPVEDIDAFSELTPQDVIEVVESVTKELMSGLQLDIAAKLREKENNLIQKINKVHRVAETT